MSIQGQPKCQLCGKPIGESADRCRCLHLRGRIEGLSFISVPPDDRLQIRLEDADPDRGWFLVGMTVIILSSLAAIAALVIVFAP